MSKHFLPLISQKSIDESKEDSSDFLALFTDKYLEFIRKSKCKDWNSKFNEEQLSLLYYDSLYGQVSNGGFIQLIQNGYGQFVFTEKFINIIKSWGAKSTSNILTKAKVFYEKYKDEIEVEASLEEFSLMYEKFIEFEELDDEFYEVMDVEINMIRKFVEKNLNKFGTVNK